MKLTTSEFTQRAENGGFPLSNEHASSLSIGHGTPLTVLPSRQFVALLLRLQAAALAANDEALAGEVSALLVKHNTFVEAVQIEEIADSQTEQGNSVESRLSLVEDTLTEVRNQLQRINRILI